VSGHLFRGYPPLLLDLTLMISLLPACPSLIVSPFRLAMIMLAGRFVAFVVISPALTGLWGPFPVGMELSPSLMSFK
jgi:hypothetical protein